MTIVELREKRAKLWATMEGFLDTQRNDKGVLSTEDDAVYANMEKELNDLTNEVRRMERRDAIAAELAKPVSSPITEQPQKASGEAKTGRASNAYREDFGLHLRGKRMLHNVLSEGVDANGGYCKPSPAPDRRSRQAAHGRREDRLPERHSRYSPESLSDSFQTSPSFPFASAQERPENRKGKESNR